MPWIMYALGVLCGLFMFGLGVIDGNLIGGGFWGLVFFMICFWIGRSMEYTTPPPRS